MRWNTSQQQIFAVLTLVAGLVTAFPMAATAQDASGGPPAGWLVRTDAGGHGGGEISFDDMPPGWHVTTGPAAILYNPETTAAGSFRIESEVFLFDPGGRNEAFGIFFGGAGLDGDAQAYTYFLIRQNGDVLIKRRDGAETSTIQGWTPSDAVVTWAARGADSPTAKNVLSVEVDAERLTFRVNDHEVYTTERAGQHVEGVVGLRVNHGLNLHVSSLEVTQN